MTASAALAFTVLVDDESWHPHDHPVPVHWLDGTQPQHLVVEAPNWANGWKWGAQAALLAYEKLRKDHPQIANPADGPDGLQVWVIVPGFPKTPVQLWREPFGRYQRQARNLPLVFPLAPVPGTDQAIKGNPLTLAKAQELWGPTLALYHPHTFS